MSYAMNENYINNRIYFEKDKREASINANQSIEKRVDNVLLQQRQLINDAFESSYHKICFNFLLGFI